MANVIPFPLAFGRLALDLQYEIDGLETGLIIAIGDRPSPIALEVARRRLHLLQEEADAFGIDLAHAMEIAMEIAA